VPYRRGQAQWKAECESSHRSDDSGSVAVMVRGRGVVALLEIVVGLGGVVALPALVLRRRRGGGAVLPIVLGGVVVLPVLVLPLVVGVVRRRRGGVGMHDGLLGVVVLAQLFVVGKAPLLSARRLVEREGHADDLLLCVCGVVGRGELDLRERKMCQE
jgi:hypothetical protein